MEVFIMRHGEAEARAATDAQRQLTEDGIQQIHFMATEYGHLLSGVDAVWSSPYIRAQQTASIMAESLGKEIVTQPFLPPNGNPIEVLGALEQYRQQTLLLVSHQPLVSILIDGLAGLEPGSHRMCTGALTCLETEVYANNCCDLKWLHHPEAVQVLYD